MKIWISKYALSSGITEHECPEPKNGFVYPGPPFMRSFALKLGSEAHTTREAAIDSAEAMRAKKINALRKQILKLENMSFM